jgi:prepilin-type N-terminal cleavage/methylation domain-containing protein
LAGRSFKSASETSDVPRGLHALTSFSSSGLSGNVIKARGFSLVELIIAVVIIGIIAAIAFTRMTRPVDGAALAALRGDLAAMRTALDLYATEHNGDYPGALAALAKYTSIDGAMSSSPTATYKYGPYMRAIPPCPIGPREGAVGWAVANANPPTAVSSFPTVGWLYHAASGGVWVNDINHLDE